MFHFPYYENDEGTYLSQAWSLIKFGKIAPYTYWYDHAPAGWFFIALWFELIGSFFAFGTSVDTGRVFILILHVLSTFFLFDIARKLTGRLFPAVISSLIYSLSPLAIYFQRMVLLDNIMTFWVLLSIWLLIQTRLTLKYVILSSICFGIAVLTKENAVFFLPGLLYILYSYVHKNHKLFAISLWISISFSFISLYFLYAIFNSELFPQGFLGNNSPHVSLISTYKLQLERGTNYSLWDPRSDINISFIQWLHSDMYFVLSTIIVTFCSLFLSIKIKRFRIVMLLVCFFLLFLVRGKLTIAFYVIPLIPFAALLIALFLDLLVSKWFLTRSTFSYNLASIILTIFVIGSFINYNFYRSFTADETSPQIQTVDWIKSHLDPQSKIIIDDAIYVDLHDMRYPGDKIFPHADWFWKVEKDPQVQRETFNNDWMNIDYIILTHDILKQIKDYSFIKKSLENSHPMKLFNNGKTDIQINNNYSSNGDWMYIYQMNNKNKIIMAESWKNYKARFIKSYGQVIDPQTNSTTSEGQSYALLRAVIQGDKPAFDGILAWTKDHFWYRNDKLTSWHWNIKEKKVDDSNSASDADEDIALALLFAYRRFGDPSYRIKAEEIIPDIWKKEVVQIKGRYYLTAGSSAKQGNGYLVNPSYFSPATYRIFAQIDTNHDWNKLAGDSYAILNDLSQGQKTASTLPPNWFFVDSDTGVMKSASKYKGSEADVYSYDAFRIMYRVALDNIWFHTPESTAYLRKMSPFFQSLWEKKKKFAAVYTLQGKPRTSYDKVSTNTAPFAAFLVTDPSTSTQIYKKTILKKYIDEADSWQDTNNYYDQNWAWFATALYTNRLQNLW